MLTHFDRERLIWDSFVDSDEKILLLALNQFMDTQGHCWTGLSLERIKRMTVLGGYFESTFQCLREKGIIQAEVDCLDYEVFQASINFATLGEFAVLGGVSHA